MSPIFLRVLSASVLVFCVGTLGVLAHSMTDRGAEGGDDGVAPVVVRVEADVPGGRYGSGHAIGLKAVLSKPARGSLVAYLTTGVAVSMTCVAAVCEGQYQVGARHVTDRLDVLFFAGSLTDAAGRVNDAPAVPAGASLAAGAPLVIGTDDARPHGPELASSDVPSRI